ncbi:MAG: complex I NDUFA9 subunit family protein [Alphaproteobacteria bacterium]
MGTFVVFGGTGFVGRSIVHHLCAAGHRVVVPTRSLEKAASLKVSGHVGQVTPVAFDLFRASEATLKTLLTDVDGVVNTVGILSPKRLFNALHVQWPKTFATACGHLGVKHLVHISALGVSPSSKSAYASSKARGEQGVLSIFPRASILRPSVIFGPGDGFLGKFAKMASFSPFLPLIGGGKTRFQPVFVGNVAAAVLAVIGKERCEGQVFSLGGPNILSFRDILRAIVKTTGQEVSFLPMPFFVASALGWVLQRLPNPPLTADQVVLLKSDNVVPAKTKTFEDLGILPTSMLPMLPDLLQGYVRGGRWGTSHPAMTDTGASVHAHL